MLEKIRSISNPLTIIAIFAGLAEISGTVVLPFLQPESQKVYLWFLMLFPTALIVLFFATLNFNYKVLYAPSDFKDEDNFLKLFGKPTPEERLAKLSEEIDQEVPSKAPSQDKTPEAPANVESKYRNIFRRNATATYYLAEELVLNKISSEFTDFKKELVLNAGGAHFMFDAVGKKGKDIYAVEVKYNSETINMKKIKASLRRIGNVYKSLPSNMASSFNVILAIASDIPMCDLVKLQDEVKQLANEQTYNVTIRLFNLPELESELITKVT